MILVPKEENTRVGPSPFSRRTLMEYFHEHSDRNGKVLTTQRDASKVLKVDFKTICRAVRELCHIGYMTSEGGGRGMHVLHHPEDCEWGPEYEEVMFAYRRKKDKRYD